MKVRIEMTVEIDAEAWVAEYGIERSQVRADVQAYVRNNVIEHLREVGMLRPD